MRTTADSRLIAVGLPSGNAAVYEVAPQHLPRPDDPQSYLAPMMFGRQVAHEKDGIWYQPSGWQPVQDENAIANLDHLKEKLWQ